MMEISCCKHVQYRRDNLHQNSVKLLFRAAAKEVIQHAIIVLIIHTPTRHAQPKAKKKGEKSNSSVLFLVQRRPTNAFLII